MAKKQPAGIYIPISAETRQFKQDMKDVNGELNASTKLANGLNKSLALDPTDINKTEKAINNMTDAIGASEQKTELLNKQLKHLEETNAPVNEIKRLEAQILQSERKTKDLNTEMDVLQSNLKKINSGEFKQLETDIQGAKREAQKFNTELKESEQLIDNLGAAFGDMLNDATGNLGAFSGIGENLGAVGVAAGVAAGGMAILNEEAERTATMIETYAGSADSASFSTRELEEVTDNMAEVLGVEVEEAAEVGTAALNMYGDSINTQYGLVVGMTSAYSAYLTGTLDQTAAMNILTTCTDTFGTSLYEANNVMMESTRLCQEYGTQAEDIADTFVEWGDTFKQLGFTADEFFRMLEQGLLLGAKNTDEVANAFNEMYLSMTEGSVETQEALAAIGIDMDAMVASVQNGTMTASQAFGELVLAIANCEDETLALTAAQAVFATQGEEWIIPLTNNTEAIEGLTQAMNLQAQATQWSATIMTDEYMAALTTVAEQMGMTSTDAANLIFALTTLGWAGLNTSQKLAVVAGGLQLLTTTGQVSQEQVNALTTDMQILGDTSSTTQEKAAALSRILGVLGAVGFLSSEQMAKLTATQMALTYGVEASTATVTDFTNCLAAEFEQAGYTEEKLLSLIERTTGVEYANLEAAKAGMSFTDALNVATEAGIINRTQMGYLEDSIAKYNDENADAVTKLTAVTEATKILHDNNLLSDQAYVTIIKSIREYITALTDSEGKNKTLAQSIVGTTDNATKNTDQFKKMADATKKSGDQTDYLQDESEELKKEMGSLEDQIRDNTREMNDYADSCWNAADAENSVSGSSSGGSGSSGNSYSANGMGYYNAPAPTTSYCAPVAPVSMQGFGSSTVTTNNVKNNTPTNNVTVIVNVDGRGAADLEELADTIADKIDEKLGGLYYD